MMVTSVLVTSGNASMGIVLKVMMPAMSKTTVANKIKYLLLSEKDNIPFNTLFINHFFLNATKFSLSKEILTVQCFINQNCLRCNYFISFIYTGRNICFVANGTDHGNRRYAYIIFAFVQ